MKLRSFFLFTYALALFATPTKAEDGFGWYDAFSCQPDVFVIPHISYATGKTVGLDEDYENGGLFLAKWCNECLYFTQADVYRFNPHNWATSVGAGLRCYNPCTERLFGANVFYDYRQGCTGNFNQLGFGVESLSWCWDIRANFYFPFETRRHSPTSVFNYPGGYVATATAYENAPYAANIEVGRFFNLGRCFDIYSAIGPYFLAYNDDFASGVRFRSGATYKGILWAEVIVTHDRLFNTRVQGVFTLAIPFGFFTGKSLAGSCYLLPLQRVDRFKVIPIDTLIDWTWNW